MSMSSFSVFSQSRSRCVTASASPVPMFRGQRLAPPASASRNRHIRFHVEGSSPYQNRDRLDVQRWILFRDRRLRSLQRLDDIRLRVDDPVFIAFMNVFATLL